MKCFNVPHAISEGVLVASSGWFSIHSAAFSRANSIRVYVDGRPRLFCASADRLSEIILLQIYIEYCTYLVKNPPQTPLPHPEFPENIHLGNHFPHLKFWWEKWKLWYEKYFLLRICGYYRDNYTWESRQNFPTRPELIYSDTDLKRSLEHRRWDACCKTVQCWQ